MNIEPAVTLIKKLEGLRLESYRDPVMIWTIGYGTTIGVKPNMVITKEEADELLEADIINYRIPGIQNSVTVELNNNEMCALVSFTYNVGLGSFRRSTLLRRLNKGEPRDHVSFEFSKWIKAGGQVSQGLINRRRMERELFIRPVDQATQTLV